MGMFDSVIVKCILPISNLPQNGWQTKCLSCTMASFVLEEDKRLYEIVPAIELTKKGELIETGETKLIDRNFEGSLDFYHCVDHRWYEFQAIMIDGEVKKFNVIKNYRLEK